MSRLSTGRSPWSADLAAGTLLLAFALLVWPGLLSGRGADPRRPDAFLVGEAADQVRYHLPTVYTFAEQLPHPNITSYRSATTPGLHLVLAAMDRWLTLGENDLRFFASLFSLSLLYVAWRFAANMAGPWRAVALVAPLLACRYFIGGSIWLMTDNTATLLCALSLAAAMTLPATGGRLVLSGVWATLGVLVRQTSLWVAGCAVLSGLLVSPLARFGPAALRQPAGERASWRPLLMALPAVLASFLVVAVFFKIWGGTTPALARHASKFGINLAAPAVTLSVVGTFGLFFLPLFVRSVGDLFRTDRTMVVAVLAGLLTAVLPATSFDFTVGRSGGPLWEYVKKFPAVADRSLLLAALAPLGAFVLVHAWRAAARAGRAREATILLVGLLGWTLTLVAAKLAYLRYYEPTLLLGLAWLGAMATVPRDATRSQRSITVDRPWAWAGPIALAVAHLAASVVAVYLPLLNWRPPV